MINMGRAIKLKNETYVCPYFPVGSIYMNVADINPSTYFGGTWEKIQNAFLFGASSTHPVGETGGEENHILTIDEMPSHDHKARYGDTAGGDGSGYRFSNTNGTNRVIIENEGGGKAHNNMPPYLAVYIWKRTT